MGNLGPGQMLGSHHPVHVGQARGDNSAQRTEEPGYIVHRRNKQISVKIGLTGNGKVGTTNKHADTGDLNSTLVKRLTSECNIENTIDELYEDLTTACNESLRTQQAPKKATSNRSVPFWTDELNNYA